MLAQPAAAQETGLPPLPTLTDPGERRGDMLYRKLGRTGESISAIGFGGSHFAKPTIDQPKSIKLCHEAIDRGITFMDNSWDYNQGVSEARMGTPIECLHHTLNRPTASVITGLDSSERIDQALEATRTFQRMGEAQMATILDKTADAAKAGE